MIPDYENYEKVGNMSYNVPSLALYTAETPNLAIPVTETDESSGKPLTPQGIKFLEALIDGNTIRKSAEIAGINLRTAHRLHASMDFQAELKAVSRRLLSEVEQSLLAGSNLAVSSLIAILENPKSSDSNKIKAAGLVLNHSLQRNEISIIQSQNSYYEALQVIDYEDQGENIYD